MELVIYLFLAIVVLGLGILSTIDRLFGIVGIMIAIIGGIYLMSDATLITNRVYDVTSTSWLGYSVPFNQVQLTAIILGMFAIADFFIVLSRS